MKSDAPPLIPVFDGHNDMLSQLVTSHDPLALWDGPGSVGHLDAARMRAGGMVGGLFAIWVPLAPGDMSLPDGLGDDWLAAMGAPPYALPLPRPRPASEAMPLAFAQAAMLHRLEQAGRLKLCRSSRDIAEALATGRIAAVMHMEGAEAISTPAYLEDWHAFGLRSLGPVWSRETRYATGVPFAHPASPDIGPGLTDAGRELISECARLRIAVDVSHLNAKGVDDVAGILDGPFVASHSNAHEICPNARNLSDRQIGIIAEHEGLVGLNFAVNFTDPEGSRIPFQGYDPMLRHLDYMLERMGEGGVGLGSDFDGAIMPADLSDAAALPGLIGAMARHGYGEALIRRIATQNWLDVLDRIWAP